MVIIDDYRWNVYVTLIGSFKSAVIKERAVPRDCIFVPEVTDDN